MRVAFAILLGALGTQGQTNVTNLAALLVALGTLAAGVVAFVRLRQDRPKVVQEVAGLAETRLREELSTAWQAVDRLHKREDELERELDRVSGECRDLRSERDALKSRVAKLERIVDGPPTRSDRPPA